MAGKVLEKSLGLLVVAAVLISVGFLYIRYIIQQDYEILYLTEEERDEFWREVAEEEGLILEDESQTEDISEESVEESRGGDVEESETKPETAEDSSLPVEEEIPQ